MDWRRRLKQRPPLDARRERRGEGHRLAGKEQKEEEEEEEEEEEDKKRR